MGSCLHLYLFLLLIIWSNYASLEAGDLCRDSHGNTCYGSIYSNLYLTLEEALIIQHSEMLKKLRPGKDDLFVGIGGLNVMLVNADITEKCDMIMSNCYIGHHRAAAFCPVSNSESTWELCDKLTLVYKTATANVEQQFIVWMSYVHGSITSFFINFNDMYTSDSIKLDYSIPDITLTIDQQLAYCNPSLKMMKCELFSWVSIEIQCKCFIYLDTCMSIDYIQKLEAYHSLGTNIRRELLYLRR